VSASPRESFSGSGLRSSALGDRSPSKRYFFGCYIAGLCRTDHQPGEARRLYPLRATARPLIPSRHATTLLQSPLEARQTRRRALL
jgi:hypothetical protein